MHDEDSANAAGFSSTLRLDHRSQRIASPIEVVQYRVDCWCFEWHTVRDRRGHVELALGRESHQVEQLFPKVIRAADDSALFAEDIAVWIERKLCLGKRDQHETPARGQRSQCGDRDLRTAGEVD